MAKKPKGSGRSKGPKERFPLKGRYPREAREPIVPLLPAEERKKPLRLPKKFAPIRTTRDAYQDIVRFVKKMEEGLSSRRQMEEIEAHERRTFSDPTLKVTSDIVVNPDGSIDAEVRVHDVPRGLPIDQVILSFQDNLRSLPGAWASAGVRLPPTEGVRSGDAHVGGMTTYGTNYRDMLTRGHADSALGVVRGEIIPKLEAKGRRKPGGAFLRIHWNENNEKPLRYIEGEGEDDED